jgi:DNA invertase Pin-like site-specific DNA recombinase
LCLYLTREYTHTTGGMNRAICYSRVSTQEQATSGVSLEAQQERLQAYCKMAELDVVAFIREEGISGSVPIAQRVGGGQLAALLKQHKAQHVVAMKLDRLFRDAEDALRQTRAWDRAGVALHVLDMGGQSINTSSAMGRMFLTMVAGFAELERNLISERTRQALAHKKAHRQAYAPTPFGYSRTGDALLALESEQSIVRGIRDWRASGLSLRAIVERLNASCVPTKRGGQWAPRTVKYLLDNDLYREAQVA